MMSRKLVTKRLIGAQPEVSLITPYVCRFGVKVMNNGKWCFIKGPRARYLLYQWMKINFFNVLNFIGTSHLVYANRPDH